MSCPGWADEESSAWAREVLHLQAHQLCRPGLPAEAGARLEAILRPFRRIAVSKLLAHLDSDHETEDFVRVEGGEYSSHFIVNEVEAAKNTSSSTTSSWSPGGFHQEHNVDFRPAALRRKVLLQRVLQEVLYCFINCSNELLNALWVRVLKLPSKFNWLHFGYRSAICQSLQLLRL